MQIRLKNSPIKTIPITDAGMAKKTVERMICGIVFNVTKSQDQYTSAFFVSDLVFSAIFEELLTSLEFTEKDIVTPQGIPDVTVVLNDKLPTHIAGQAFSSQELKVITSLFWPAPTAWYVPIWKAKAMVTKYLESLTDERTAIERLHVLSVRKSMELLRMYLQSSIARFEDMIFVTVGTGRKYSYLTELLAQLDHVERELEKDLANMHIKHTPAIALSLWTFIEGAERKFREMHSISIKQFDLLFAAALAENKEQDISLLIDFGLSRTQAKNAARMASRASKDALCAFLSGFGGTDAVLPSNSPQDKRFYSGHGSYQID